MKKLILPLFVILSIILMAIYSPILSKNLRDGKIFPSTFSEGVVTKVIEENLMYDPIVKTQYRGGQTLKVKILEGEYKNKTFTVYNSLNALHNTYAYPGLKAIFTIKKENDKYTVWLYNLKRENGIYLLTFIFFLITIILGKLKGVKSLLALTFSGACIIYILIPLLFKGLNPILVSISLSSIMTIISFLLIGDFNKKTYSAILGTMAGLLVAGIISLIFTKFMKLNGLYLNEGEQLLYIAKEYKLQVGSLLFVSILISSLGAIMDVAMSISSTTNEIIELNPNISNKELFISIMNIGKDIVGTMINTLVLAFAGTSLPLMLMIWGYGMVYTQFINIPTIAIEILNGLAGSIGIIATVPLTAIISIFLFKKNKQL